MLSNDWVRGDQQFYLAPTDVVHCGHFNHWRSKNTIRQIYSTHKMSFKHNKEFFSELIYDSDEPDYALNG